MHESDWGDIVPANSTPFERTTNLTLQSTPDNIARRDYYAFNGGYVKDKLYNVFKPQTGCIPVGGSGPGTAPGGDLSATTAAVAAADLSPPAATAKATAGRVPWLQRCWAVRREYVDIATTGAIFGPSGRPERTYYWTWALKVDVLCDAIASPECVAQLGPLGCYQSTLFQVILEPPGGGGHVSQTGGGGGGGVGGVGTVLGKGAFGKVVHGLYKVGEPGMR
eukprot:XP_001703076.1 predicted protein [Chlamydomonas reinhardtii]